MKGPYSIQGTDQTPGFSIVVRTMFSYYFVSTLQNVHNAGYEKYIDRKLLCFTFLYQEPVITDIIPDCGPLFGGTTVTLTGRYLDSGIERSVFFADKKCNNLR